MASTAYTEAWLAGPQSTQFYTRTYLPPTPTPTKAVIVFIHGFAEHVGRYTHFHPIIAKRGIAIFTLDQRGFGLTALDTEGKKSRSSSWGKTSWVQQMGDIDWAVKHAKEEFKDTPIFLAGHSMGGGETLGFVSQEERSPNKASVSLLSGAIATSPLITQTNPAPKVAKWLGGKASVLLPNTLVPAAVKPEELSHDEAFNSAYMSDPLIKQTGTLRGLFDMLSNGEKLLRQGYRRWPKNVPLLIIHGTADQVTNHQSSQTFINSLPADYDKKLTLIEGGYHELQNEPDGVKERVADEIVAFIEGHLPSSLPSQSVEAEVPKSTTEEATESSEDAPLKANL